MSDQFNFKYTAPTEEERLEIDSIRRQYSVTERTESKLERLRRLNSKVKNTAIVFAYVFGIVGCLIFGLGLTMILEWNIFLWGIAVMFFGGIIMSVDYPVYKFILNKGKAKYGGEILRLSDELLNNK